MAEGGESRAGQRGRGRGKCWQARPEARRDAEPTSQTQFWAPGGPASRSFQSPVGRRDAGTGTRRLPEAELKHGEQLHRQMPLRCPAAVSFLHLSGPLQSTWPDGGVCGFQERPPWAPSSGCSLLWARTAVGQDRCGSVAAAPPGLLGQAPLPSASTQQSPRGAVNHRQLLLLAGSTYRPPQATTGLFPSPEELGWWGLPTGSCP